MFKLNRFLVLAGLSMASTAGVQAASFIGLGDLPGGAFSSEASSVSSDGTVVAGAATSEFGGEAFRWTAATGMVGLGDFPGGEYHSYAHDVSADGSVIVGYGNTDTKVKVVAFRWTEATGLVDIDPGKGPRQWVYPPMV